MVRSDITIVLVGHTGNGKSATGNSILGGSPFISMPSASSVTRTCELKSKQLSDGRTINVIDTQGFGDIFTPHELIIEELTKCFNLAKNAIHVFLLVVSVRSRFSKEEATAIRNLQTILGANVINYVVVAFTGGDDLEDQNKTLDDYLGYDCPYPLKEFMRGCGERCVLFDNRTKSEAKRVEQVEQLFSIVDEMIHQNGGAPFKHGLYELTKGNEELLNAITIGYNSNNEEEETRRRKNKKDTRTLTRKFCDAFAKMIQLPNKPLLICVLTFMSICYFSYKPVLKDY